MTTDSEEGALDGLRIVELAERISGPYCGKLLADLGADVIKIEAPRTGDPQRYEPPFFEDDPSPDAGLVFNYLNANKSGITLHVDQPRGRELLTALVEQADVLLLDGAPADLEARALDFDIWHARFPQLVCTYVTPYGLTGPHRDRKVDDLVSQQLSAMGIGTPRHRFDENPIRRPLAVGGNQALYGAGMAAAVATMHALFAREMRGEGQLVDVSEVEPMASFQMLSINRWVYTGDPGDLGYGEGARRVWCSDGPVAVMLFTGQERQWLAFQELLGNPEWMRDPKYHPPIADPEDREVFWAQISAWAGDFTREEVYRRAQGLRIPVFPVNSISDVVDSDQIAAREFMQPMQLANGATVSAPSAPYQLSETPVRHLRPAPTLGRDNIEVLCGRLDVSKQEIIDGFQAGLF